MMGGAPDMGGDPNAMMGDPNAMMDNPNAMGGAPDMGGDPNAMMGDPNAMGGDPNQSQFDTNFDAGVEADEDEDPKHYIQQLTGKLSTTLSSYLNDTEDNGLAKYVGKMILKQAVKGLDGKGKKELIKAIKMDETEDEELPEDDGSEMPQDGMEDDGMQQNTMMPMQESVFTKKQLRRLAESINPSKDEESNTDTKMVKKIKNSRFLGKRF